MLKLYFIGEGAIDVQLFKVDDIIEVYSIGSHVIIVCDDLNGFDVLNASDIVVIKAVFDIELCIGFDHKQVIVGGGAIGNGVLKVNAECAELSGDHIVFVAEVSGGDVVEQGRERNGFAFFDVVDVDADGLSGGIATCVGGDDVEGVGGLGFEIRGLVDGDLTGLGIDGEGSGVTTA